MGKLRLDRASQPASEGIDLSLKGDSRSVLLVDAKPFAVNAGIWPMLYS